MNNGIIELSLWQMIASYIFVAALLIIVRLRGIAREKEIVLSSVRMTIQLVFVGYLLVYVFEHPHPAVTGLIWAVMLGFAIFNIFQRVKVPLSSRLKRAAAASMIFGTGVSLVYFVTVVVGLFPWYDPRYFIPIAGMLIGNSMTGISLGVKSLVETMSDQRDQVEAALMLGAAPAAAVKPIANSAFDSAILPTINSMMGMGIVFLPGMMTGQILSGESPVTAIQYQIAIMLGIVGSVSLTVIVFLYLGSRVFFNDRAQLVRSEVPDA